MAFCGTKPEGGAALIAELSAAGCAPPCYEACDVRDIAALQALLQRVGKSFGPIRVLVYNAGRDDRHSLDELTPGCYRRREFDQGCRKSVTTPGIAICEDWCRL